MPDVTEPHTPWRYGSVTPSCHRCGGGLPTGRARRFCSNRCRQAAYRARSSIAPPAPAPPTPGRRRSQTSVYECANCGQRMAGQRRCDECGLFARRVGDGGCCTACGEILTVTELLAGN